MYMNMSMYIYIYIYTYMLFKGFQPPAAESPCVDCRLAVDYWSVLKVGVDRSCDLVVQKT